MNKYNAGLLRNSEAIRYAILAIKRKDKCLNAYVKINH